MERPSPILSISSSPHLDIPRVGYSYYKTASDQVERCTSLALFAGITHFDMATVYNSNHEISKALERHLRGGRKATKAFLSDKEKPELLEILNGVYRQTIVSMSLDTNLRKKPSLALSEIGKHGRRNGLFLSYKLSNEEQSTDPKAVRRAVLSTIQNLGSVDYLDMVSIHSPLTDSSRRLTTYQTLLNLQQDGLVRSVGVCNYGVRPLEEIVVAGMQLPITNQLELSPFNTHTDVVDWCDTHGVAVSCAAWSRLSSADGPTDQWGILSQLAHRKGMTKAQILVRWSLQKGYICMPRSGSASKLERKAIAENSYGGVNMREDADILTPEEMMILDGLNVSFKAGKLGRRDGWTDSDVTGPDWDPTEVV
jgi:diketogulonate reductase-like aldo/keto reductase